mmetsp:Transcript_70814/g.213050  ORF Transcript_70814/g.213050 Transcript_70814/m.213050 type:complete len:392 (-) Transcript_70814:121-1296(-)
MTWANATLALNDPWSDDQGVFNRLITGTAAYARHDPAARRSSLYPVKAAGLDGRLIEAPHGLVLAPLAADRFCSGHLVWVQQAAKPLDCIAVHATFTEFGDAGKRWRFLEAGLWAPLAPSYFNEGHYLTFEPPEPPVDPAPCPAGAGVGMPPTSCGGEDPRHGLPRKRMGNIPSSEGMRRSSRLRANVELMGRQVHALRDALAVVRVLNRTLIMPHFDCLCDRSELTEVVPSCLTPGTPPRLPVPFKCSLHFVTDSHKLQMMIQPAQFGMSPAKFGGVVTPPMPVRAHSFLTDVRTAPAIRDSLATVSLPRASNNEQVLSALVPHRDTRVLRLADALGSFGGWVSNTGQGQLFNTMMEYYLLGGSWCCTSRTQEEGRVHYSRPPPITVRRG